MRPPAHYNPEPMFGLRPWYRVWKCAEATHGGLLIDPRALADHFATGSITMLVDRVSLEPHAVGGRLA